jgi:hypothetical protein
MNERLKEVCPLCSEVHPLLAEAEWSDDPERMGCTMAAEAKACDDHVEEFIDNFDQAAELIQERRKSEGFESPTSLLESVLLDPSTSRIFDNGQ